MKTDGEKLRTIYEWLAKNLDCNTFFSGESVNELISRCEPEYCEENCGPSIIDAKCWQKYFDLKFVEKDNGQ